MSEQFDVNYKWLGIPPEKQPPSHYQLVGVEDFESHDDVIDSAADQRMPHVRSFQAGEHSKPTLTSKVAAVAVRILVIAVILTIISSCGSNKETDQDVVVGRQSLNSTKDSENDSNDVEDGKVSDENREDDPNNSGDEIVKGPTVKDESHVNADDGETAPAREEVDPFSSIKPFARPSPSTPDAPTKKHPVPTDEQQKPILATLVETFKLSEKRSRAQQLELARQFFSLANKSTDAIEKFALLRGTIVYAGEGGDAHVILSALNELDHHFVIDKFEIGQKALIGFAELASTKESLDSLKEPANNFIDEAIVAGRVDIAKNVTESIYDVLVKRPVAAAYPKQALDLRNRIRELHTQWQAVQNAIAKLETSSDDPEANETVGRWTCFVKRDWKTGLPQLAKAASPSLRMVAQRELSGEPRSSQDEQAIADVWWEIAQSEDGITKKNLQQRAASWYLRTVLSQISASDHQA